MLNKIIQYFREVVLELSKVSWPNRQEVTKLTLIVVVISSVVGIYVGSIDFLLTKILELALIR